MAASLPPPVPPPKEAKKRAMTIKDVARSAGVHFTTVSLALRDHPSLPAATKKRIQEIADRMGYTRNPVFSALTHFHLRGRVRADPMRIGYLTNRSLEQEGASNRSQLQILAGAREQAKLLGYDIELMLVEGTRHGSRWVEDHLRERKISGIIVAAFDPGFARLSLHWDDYSIVKIDSLHMEPDALVVGSDHRQDVRLAFQRMRALGYRRIGLAVGRADEDATERLYTAGYLLEQGTVPADERVPELLFPYNCSVVQASRMLGEWIRYHRVEAVLCNWSDLDEMLRRARLQVPADVACASLSLMEPGGRLAGVCPNPRMVGAKAVSLLATLFKSGERGVPESASRTYVKSYWQDGASAPQKS
jgi:LacI family transcriptional regulator